MLDKYSKPHELRVEHLEYALRQMRLLVVLDNLDIPDRWPPLAGLLRSQSMLITTRSAELKGVPRVPVDRLPEGEGLELFKKHAEIIDGAKDAERLWRSGRRIVRDWGEWLDGRPLRGTWNCTGGGGGGIGDLSVGGVVR